MTTQRGWGASCARAAARAQVRRAVLGAAAFPLLFLASAGNPVAAPPPSAFGPEMKMYQVALSPDGERVAYASTEGGRKSVVVGGWRPGAGAKLAIDLERDLEIAWIDWVKPERILIGLRLSQWHGRDSFSRVLSVSPDGEDQRRLFEGNIQYDLDGVLARLPDDPHHVVMQAVGDNENMNVYRVDVRGGRPQPIETGNRDTWSWIVDRTGAPRFRFDWDDDAAAWKLLLRAPGDDAWSEIERWRIGEAVRILPLPDTSDRDHIAYVWTAPPGSDRRGIARYDLVQRRIVGAVRANPRVDVTDVLTDPWTGRFLGVRFVEDLWVESYEDEDLVEVQAVLERAYPGAVSRLVIGSARARAIYLAVVEGSREPGTYVVYDREARALVEIGRRRPGLTREVLGEGRRITYQGRDGTPIPAYLTVPPDSDGKHLPLIVLPHGGPQARDDLAFDPLVQFLATRGYAVLQPNFRGSDGLGDAWRDAGRRQWGTGVMQHDVTDGVRYAVAEGIADPRRVCIVGWSYGGYSALAGAAFTPEVYRCAVSIAGIADLVGFSAQRRMAYGRHSPAMAHLRAMIGEAAGEQGLLRAASPALHADRVTAAVLLLHGENDVVVHPEQSREMHARLQAAGKQSRLVTYADADHGLLGPDASDRHLAEIESFLATHLATP